MLKITKSLTTLDGDIIPEAYGRLKIMLEKDELNATVQLFLYREEDSLEQGFKHIFIKEITKYTLKEQLTETQYNNLSIVGVHTFIKNKLEQILGNNTVTILL